MSTRRERRRRDEWSPWLSVLALLAVIAFWWALVAGTFLASIAALLFTAFVGVSTGATAVGYLVTGRRRSAISFAAASAIVIGGFFPGQKQIDWVRKADFDLFHRADCERAVAGWRVKQQNAGPLRLVVSEVDRSIMLVHIADQIAYDETDSIGSDPTAYSGDWDSAMSDKSSEKNPRGRRARVGATAW